MVIVHEMNKRVQLGKAKRPRCTHLEFPGIDSSGSCVLRSEDIFWLRAVCILWNPHNDLHTLRIRLRLLINVSVAYPANNLVLHGNPGFWMAFGCIAAFSRVM